jgi:hypothetical protein
VSSVLQQAILRLLRPVVRLMIRHNVPLATFVDLLRHVYVAVAKEELALPGKKLSDSRISVVTGIPRKDIKRYSEEPKIADEEVAASHNRAARVLTGWIQDKVFHDQGTDKPMDLPVEIEGEEPSFQLLVQRYSGGVPHRAVLDELLRINAVRKLGDGKLRLVTFGYIPSSDALDQMKTMSEEISDFLRSVDHNINSPLEDSFLQLAVRCDNLPLEALENIERVGSHKGRALLQEMAEEISLMDRDQNEKVYGTGRHRVVMGVYYFQEELEGDQIQEVGEVGKEQTDEK